MTCEFCYSSRGVTVYDFPPDPPRALCEVCSRLHGTQSPSLTDIVRNQANLFHALGLLPHDSDDEEEGGEE